MSDLLPVTMFTKKWWVACILKVNIGNGETLLQSSATFHLFQYLKMVIVTIPIHNVFVTCKIRVMCKLWIKDKAWQKCPDPSTRQCIYVYTMLLIFFK